MVTDGERLAAFNQMGILKNLTNRVLNLPKSIKQALSIWLGWAVIAFQVVSTEEDKSKAIETPTIEDATTIATLESKYSKVGEDLKAALLNDNPHEAARLLEVFSNVQDQADIALDKKWTLLNPRSKDLGEFLARDDLYGSKFERVLTDAQKRDALFRNPKEPDNYHDPLPISIEVLRSDPLAIVGPVVISFVLVSAVASVNRPMGLMAFGLLAMLPMVINAIELFDSERHERADHRRYDTLVLNKIAQAERKFWNALGEIPALDLKPKARRDKILEDWFDPSLDSPTDQKVEIKVAPPEVRDELKLPVLASEETLKEPPISRDHQGNNRQLPCRDLTSLMRGQGT